MNENLQCRRAHHDDLDGVATTLARSFQDDPVFGWCVPDAHRRRAVLPAFFRLVAEALLPGDELHVAARTSRPATTAVDGAAVWVPAGTDVGELELGELFGDDAERVGAIVTLLEEHHPRLEHQYLWFVGVDPAAQGRGIGGTLLAAGPAGPAYLEATSADNRRLYERHGFVVVDELSVSTSPPLWAMWRC